MSRPPLFDIAQDRLDELVKFVRALDDGTRQVILDSLAKRLTDPVLKRQLAEIQRLARATDAQVRQWLTDNVPQSYFDGFDFTNRKTRTRRITYEVFLSSQSTVVHRNAVNLLLKDSYGDFGRTMASVVGGAERMLTDAARQQIRGQIVAGEIEGRSIPKIARDIRQAMQDQGFRVLLDRAGRKWQLPDYSEMLARTHLIRTANEGVVNRMQELGYDIVEWSTADVGACPICEPLDGKLFSLSGSSSKYAKLDPEPPAHPNCRCSLLPRPEVEP